MIAFGLKEHVSYGEGLVHNQNLRINGNIQGEGQTDKHTAGIGLYGLVNEVSNIRKFQNGRELLIHLCLTKAHHGAVHIDIFNAGIILVKAGAQLQKSADAPPTFHLSCGGTEHPGYNLQHSGLAGAVGTDNPHCLSSSHGKGNVSQGIEILMVRFFPKANAFQ